MSRPETGHDEDAGHQPVVLVVDDAPSSLSLLCDMLEQAGYTVLVAQDGEAALRTLELVVPDAILLDGVMPGLSGFETCRRIQQRPEWAHVPVIFMTGLGDTDSVLEGFGSGAVDYVVKPVRAPEVLARLRTHTRNARIVRQAREALDVATLGVMLVDAQGRIAWRSPKAAAWLNALGHGEHKDEGELPDAVAALIGADGAQAQLESPDQPGQVYVVRNMGVSGLGETMLLLDKRPGSAAARSRLASAALTAREAEVLSWLAKGKTNKDIADILGMSPRTVNKHLEHVFRKLGVETRAAAAALVSSVGTQG